MRICELRRVGYHFHFFGNPRVIFWLFLPNTGISANECNKIRMNWNNLQGYHVSSRISREPSSQITRKYPTLALRQTCSRNDPYMIQTWSIHVPKLFPVHFRNSYQHCTIVSTTINHIWKLKLNFMDLFLRILCLWTQCFQHIYQLVITDTRHTGYKKTQVNY